MLKNSLLSPTNFPLQIESISYSNDVFNSGDTLSSGSKLISWSSTSIQNVTSPISLVILRAAEALQCHLGFVHKT